MLPVFLDDDSTESTTSIFAKQVMNARPRLNGGRDGVDNNRSYSTLFNIMKCTNGVLDNMQDQSLKGLADLVATTRPNKLAISLTESNDSRADEQEWEDACERMSPFVDCVTSFNLLVSSSSRRPAAARRQQQYYHYSSSYSLSQQQQQQQRGLSPTSNTLLSPFIMRSLLPRMLKLRHLEISDPLLGYLEPVFCRVLPYLHEIESIELCGSDSTSSIFSPGSHLDRSCCQAISYAITNSCPKFREFQLHRVSFQSHNDFELILKALQHKVELEDMQFTGLSCKEQQLPDSVFPSYLMSGRNSSMVYTKYVMEKHPIMVEHLNVMKYLQENYISDNGKAHRRYTLSQRLDAVLKVRQRMAIANNAAAATTTTTTAMQQLPLPNHHHLFSLVDSLSVISNQPDFCFQLLRYEGDPGHWAITN